MYNLANWNNISRWVDTEIRRNNLLSVNINEANIEEILVKTTNIVKEAQNKIPLRKFNVWQSKLSQTTLHLIGQRNKFRRKLQRSYNNTERIYLSAVLKQLNNMINIHVSNDRNKNWNVFLKSLPAGNKMWKINKAIRGRTSTFESLTIDGVDVYDNKTKAKAIADVFENSHQITLNMLSKWIKEYLNTSNG